MNTRILTSLARHCELYRIPANTAERVEDRVRLTPLSDMTRDRFRRDAKPAGLVHQDVVCSVAREEFVALVEVWANRSAARGERWKRNEGDLHFWIFGGMSE